MGFYRWNDRYIRKTNRSHIPRADELVVKTKQVFLKALLHVLIFKTKALGVPIPSKNVLTHRGTWLEATSYHWQYFK